MVIIKTKIEEEFENWRNINSGRINIEKGIQNVINLKLEEYNLETYPIKNNTENNIKINIDVNLNLIAPVNSNTQVGEIEVLYNSNMILKIGILTDNDIKKKSVFDYIFEITQYYNTYLEKVI